MKRPVWVTASLVLQLLSTFALLGLSVYLLVLSAKKPHTASDLRAGALMFAAPGLFSAIGGYGLWKRKLWGWWLASICDWGVAALFVYAVIDDGWSMIDWSLVSIAVCSLILPIWLAMPATRKFYWNITNLAEV